MIHRRLYHALPARCIELQAVYTWPTIYHEYVYARPAYAVLRSKNTHAVRLLPSVPLLSNTQNKNKNIKTKNQLPFFLFFVFQVYSSALAYQAALPPSTSPSVDDEGEEREALSPFALNADGGGNGRGRKSSARTVFPPRSPSDGSSANTSPAPYFFYTSGSASSGSGGGGGGGGGGPGGATAALANGPGLGLAVAAAVGGGGGGGGAPDVGGPPGVGHGRRGGSGGAGAASPRGGGLPELWRQVGLQLRSERWSRLRWGGGGGVGGFGGGKRRGEHVHVWVVSKATMTLRSFLPSGTYCVLAVISGMCV